MSIQNHTFRAKPLLWISLSLCLLIGCSSVPTLFPVQPQITPTVHVPQVSNGLIAFTIPQEDESTDIYTIRPDGTDLKRLTDDPGNDYHPHWTPDGTQIFYISEATEGCLDVMNADGSNKHCIPLTIDGESLEPPVSRALSQLAWSPDGKKVAFTVTYDISPVIYAMNVDGSDLHQVYDLPAMSPSWSPDGQRIMFWDFAVDSDHIGVVDADGTNERQIPVGDLIDPYSPYWSRDGQRIFFSARASQSDLYSSKIYVMESSGLNLRPVLDLPGAWDEGGSNGNSLSPDGSRLFITVRGLQEDEMARSLVVLDAHDYSVKHIFPQSVVDNVLWSPDSQKILYQDGEYNYHIIGVDGSWSQPLTLAFDHVSGVVWQPVTR